MTGQLTLGYRTAVADHDHLLAVAGRRVTGHDFHRTSVEPPAGALAGWLVDGRRVGFSADPAGLGRPTLHASYLHIHWAGHPQLAQRFADAVHDHAAQHRGYDLRHHGDSDIADGLIDLAVNVRLSRPPDWLVTIINSATDRLAAYPRPEAAREAIATAHRVGIDQVLPTSGGAEAFGLLARALPWSRPVVIHPQFSEPEAALEAAGRPPRRVLPLPRKTPVDPAHPRTPIGDCREPDQPDQQLQATTRSGRRYARLAVAADEASEAIPANRTDSGRPQRPDGGHRSQALGFGRASHAVCSERLARRCSQSLLVGLDTRPAAIEARLTPHARGRHRRTRDR